ncbi:MAG: SycD/LcrH family type III secretion system chaperone [Chlamydiales bacterium]|nr:SycD/LcrH family type III secretion system chaperone [Chlamydiales bacterium]
MPADPNMDEDQQEFLVPREALERLNDADLLREYVEDGKSFQEILGYSDETMEQFYNAAYSLMQKHRYKEASDAFVFLTTLNPFVPEYWLGMGMCEQINQDYEQALVAYSMVVIGDRYQPLAHYHSAACHHALGDNNAALRSLEKAITLAEGEPEFADTLEQAIRSKNLLSSRER